MISDEELYFFAEALEFARSKPLPDCLKFLRGLLGAIEKGHPYHKVLRSLIAQLSSTDAQLELLQIGQLKLDLDGAAPSTAKKKGKS